jgi:predicted HD phosphohydrolase
MRPDKYKKRFRAPRADARVRGQIALEAARRMIAAIGPRDATGHLQDATEAEYYAAKRRAAAVLGHPVRPGDLPSDSEVREQVLALARSGASSNNLHEDEPQSTVQHLADHLDRFAIYKLRLEPLEAIKQNVTYHPEGDALYHSLQVFGLARDVRPYDEEFLLAALLHDVGKAVDPKNHVFAGLEALRGTITERTRWLIEHHMDLLARPGRTISPRLRQELVESEYYDDLVLLRDIDEAGRVPGVPVDSIEEALDYVRTLYESNEHDEGHVGNVPKS